MNTIENFRSQLLQARLPYADPIIADGKLHRFRATGDRNNNSWYILHVGPPAAGAFGCWKRGIKETWHEKRRESVSDVEWKSIRARWQEAERERETVESKMRDRARKTAAWILPRSKPVDSHSYFKSKGVKVFGDVREYRGAVVLPLRDADAQLHSLQFVHADGFKKFLTGGRMTECFFTLADKPDGPLVLCEGYATGASIHEATGFAVVCGMNCGNLLAVARVLRAKWPQREIVLAADDDKWTDGNPGLTKATAAAHTAHAKLARPQFADVSGEPSDFNDLHRLEGLNTVKQQIENAQAPIETDAETFARLATLSPVQYDRCRESEAKRVSIRVGTLDEEVAKLRLRQNESQPQSGAVEFTEVEPWKEAVNGVELLDEIEKVQRRFIVAEDAVFTTCSLFALHTFAYDLGDVSPILFITGPTKRCGKSREASVLKRIVNRPLFVSSASAAGIYRTIELYHPTLMIDEVDAFLKGDEQLRGLINSGHTRDAARHLGCVPSGDGYEPRWWSTWTPKIFSGIGRLADTIEDRAFIVAMRRRRKGEKVERLRDRISFEDLRRKCATFVADNAEAIRNADPQIPSALNDRAADNWTPLFALADLAGGDWPEKARAAAIALSGSSESEVLGTAAQLLADVQQIFADAKVDKISSQTLCERLVEIEGRPWAEFGKNQKPISKNQLANVLREFNIHPHGVRIGADTPRGYELADFADAFSRYLPDKAIPQCNIATAPATVEQKSLFESATPTTCCSLENADKPNAEAVCGSVALQNAPLFEEVV